MGKQRKPRIVVTGPESTGKTTLAKQLAAHFGGICVPEHARKYVENLQRPYNYKDIVAIAKEQIQRREDSLKEPDKWFIFDTDLIILKIWFEEVFVKYPEWIEKNIKKNVIDYYLLCATDIPWIDDPVRENPGAKRNYLFSRYRRELEDHGFSYFIVTGTELTRFNNAFAAIKSFFHEVES